MRLLSLIFLGLLSGFEGPALAQEPARPGPRPDLAPAVDEVSDVLPEADVARLPISLLPSERPATLLETHRFRIALAASYREEWVRASSLIADGTQVEADVIAWRRLRAGEADFEAYLAFLERNGDWPGLDRVRQQAERAIPVGADAAQVLTLFGDRSPSTGRGALRLAAALAASGDADAASAVVQDAWAQLPMRALVETELLANWGEIISGLHETRLEMLLWAGDREGALRARARVGADWQALADARLALQRDARGVDALIDAVPENLSANGGLAFDRVIWRIENRQRDAAIDLILSQSTSAAALGEPRKWANWRRILARQTMRNGDGARAYALASTHYIAHTQDFYAYADLEWLSGYLALRYLDDPEQALAHFQRFEAAVFTPISLGRAFYWQGRAYEALGDSEAAQASYRAGGVHQSSFYGQLAAEKAGLEMDPAFTAEIVRVPWQGTELADNAIAEAAGLFHQAGQSWEVIRFLGHLADTLDEAALPALVSYAESLEDPYISVRVAKRLARRGVIDVGAYFPLVDLVIALPVEEALALSIARRESEFNIAAISPAGARGLMQVMPATAQNVARKLGLDYQLGKLTTDAVFNATLGSAYLAELIDEFGESYPLVAAGYNAGPGRPRSWIELYGDPRLADVDAVDWVEHVPFRETRNYVMRVMESVPIYRARLTGEPQALNLSEMLKAR
ncbi:MAG: lytic transglycosylase domain-containing protein [Pseudomonadota bacterium]